jgi:hypothetical protein
MKGEHMLMYALVFVLGFMVARMMGGRLIEGTINPYGGFIVPSINPYGGPKGSLCVDNLDCHNDDCDMSRTWKVLKQDMGKCT